MTLLVIEARNEDLPAEGTSEPQDGQTAEYPSELDKGEENSSEQTSENELRSPLELSLRTKLTKVQLDGRFGLLFSRPVEI